MKTLDELRSNHLEVRRYNSDGILRLSKGDYVNHIDYDVYLPSLHCNLQRGFVWNQLQKEELIWSVIYQRHIPGICIVQQELYDKSGNRIRTWQIIDGKQRLSTLISFVRDEFTISIEGCRYKCSELDSSIRSEIERFSFETFVVWEYSDTPISDEDKIKWFHRINFAGTQQDELHIVELMKKVNIQ